VAQQSILQKKLIHAVLSHRKLVLGCVPSSYPPISPDVSSFHFTYFIYIHFNSNGNVWDLTRGWLEQTLRQISVAIIVIFLSWVTYIYLPLKNDTRGAVQTYHGPIAKERKIIDGGQCPLR
jgi:hypothetical protein